MLTASVLAVCLLAASCQRPLIVKDDDSKSKAHWELLDYPAERLVLGLHATPFELYVISENQFSRYDGNRVLLEKRPLDVGSGITGTPALSDNAFVRMTTDDQSRQTIEFHLARNPAQIVKIIADDLLSDGEGHLEVEYFARRLGAFSTDGALFLLPARLLPARHYVLFLFELEYNTAHTTFTSVKSVKRINLPELGTLPPSMNNVRFADGNFYVTSQHGAWRITPSGDVLKIFPQWMRDVFEWQDKLYITGLNSFDLHESTDKGLTWTRLNQNSELKMVETVGDLVLTHEVLGNPYLSMLGDFVKAKKIVYPAGASTNPSVYYGAAFFAGQYFFSIDREVYFTDKVVVE